MLISSSELVYCLDFPALCSAVKQFYFSLSSTVERENPCMVGWPPDGYLFHKLPARQLFFKLIAPPDIILLIQHQIGARNELKERAGDRVWSSSLFRLTSIREKKRGTFGLWSLLACELDNVRENDHVRGLGKQIPGVPFPGVPPSRGLTIFSSSYSICQMPTHMVQ